MREIKAPALQGFPEDPGPLSWSADGRTLRYVTSIGPREEHVSWLTSIRRDGSGLQQVPLPVKAQTLDWAPAGLPLAFSTRTYYIDGDKGGAPVGPKPALYVVDELDKTARRIAQISRGTGESAIEEPAFSPIGKRILYQRTQRHLIALWMVRSDGSEPRALVSGLVSAEDVAWSPNGGQIALHAFAGGGRRQSLYVVDPSSGHLRGISDDEILDGPVWSPDGRWIAYSDYDGEICRVRPDGSGRQVIAELPGQEIRGLLWSPDGRHLAYTARDFPPED